MNPLWRNILFLALAALVCVFSVFVLFPEYHPQKIEPSDQFSALRAREHYRVVAAAPHMTGSIANGRVRDSIIAWCDSFKLETKVDTGIGIRSYHNYTAGAKTFNIRARLKGSGPGKAIYIVSHYDSAPNSYGAGDDGAAVVGMMECIRALKTSSKAFKNDFVFLFTDAEEIGLLGADAAVRDSAIKADMAMVFNYDGTAVRGASMLLEVNPATAPMLSRYSKLPHPFGTSVSSEVKKRTPGDVDFTIFKKAAIPGFSTVLAEGRSHYHSLVDRPEFIDSSSLQQQGENMLALIRQFGDVDLNSLKGNEVTYFTVWKNWLVRYPVSWNLWLVLLCNALFIVSFIVYLKEERESNDAPWTSWLAGIARFMLTILLAVALNNGLINLIHKLYPQNNVFYNSEAYNAWIYYIALGMTTVAVFGFVYSFGKRALSVPAAMAGFHTVVLLLVDYGYTILPNAIYFLLIPLLFSLLAHIIRWRQGDSPSPGFGRSLIGWLAALAACLLLPPIIYFSYAGTYGLSIMAMVHCVPILFLLGFLMPFWKEIEFRIPLWLPGIAFMAVIVCMLIAHLSSNFSSIHPLRSSLYYRMDADAKKASWWSDFPVKDRWNKIYLGNNNAKNSYDSSLIFAAFEGRQQIEAPAAAIDVLSPEIRLAKDSSSEGTRFVQLNFVSANNPEALRVVFDKGVVIKDLLINDIPVTDATQDFNRLIQFAGLGDDSLRLAFRMKSGVPLPVTLIECKRGLPEQLETVVRPDDIVPMQGYNSNTTQIKIRREF